METPDLYIKTEPELVPCASTSSQSESPPVEHLEPVEHLCRLCGSIPERTVEIYSAEGISNELSDKINEYLPVKVSPEDKLPLCCCWNCVSTLISFHDLVISCVEAEKRLQCIVEEQPKPIPILIPPEGLNANSSEPNDEETEIMDEDTEMMEEDDEYDPENEEDDSEEEEEAESKPMIPGTSDDTEFREDLVLKCEVDEDYVDPLMDLGCLETREIDPTDYTSHQPQDTQSVRLANDNLTIDRIMKTKGTASGSFPRNKFSKRTRMKLKDLADKKSFPLFKYDDFELAFNSVLYGTNYQLSYFPEVIDPSTDIEEFQTYNSFKGNNAPKQKLSLRESNASERKLSLKRSIASEKKVGDIIAKGEHFQNATGSNNTLETSKSEAVFKSDEIFRYVKEKSYETSDFELCVNQYITKFTASKELTEGHTNETTDFKSCINQNITGGMTSEEYANEATDFELCIDQYKIEAIQSKDPTDLTKAVPSSDPTEENMNKATDFELCINQYKIEAVASKNLTKKTEDEPQEYPHFSLRSHDCVQSNVCLLSKDPTEENKQESHSTDNNSGSEYEPFGLSDSEDEYIPDSTNQTEEMPDSSPQRDSKQHTLKTNYSIDEIRSECPSVVKDGVTFYSCKFCKTLTSVNQLKRHFLSHIETYKCTKCNQTFRQDRSLKRHMQTIHYTKPVTCAICYKTFSRKYNLLQHMRWHLNYLPYKCKRCNKGFTRSILSKRHEAVCTASETVAPTTANSEKFPFLCRYCNVEFGTQESIRSHFEEFHYEVREGGHVEYEKFRLKKKDGSVEYKCDYCGQIFSIFSKFRVHRKRHVEKAGLKCHICKMVCRNKHAFMKHIRIKHSSLNIEQAEET